jgi:four helix bundle protein
MARDESPKGFLLKQGNYRELRSYRKAELVYDLTQLFCARFLKRGDRTIDQMVQAARSGKQNIVEGSKSSKTSKEMELKLTGVARASLEELLIDYEDYLRTNRAAAWSKDSKEAEYVRRLGNNPELKFEDIRCIRGDPAWFGGGKHRPVFDPSSQLSARSAAAPAGTGFSQGRRPPRADDKSPAGKPGSGEIGLI